MAYRREVLLDTQLYEPMALIWHSAISVSGKGGEKTGDSENDLDSDTSPVHSQLRVRGDVSPGQYHSTVTVVAICPCVLSIDLSIGASPPSLAFSHRDIRDDKVRPKVPK